MPSSAAHARRMKDDLLYAHGIARRAVARAALHFGIDGMTCETLDTLSSCLLAYLERLGGAMAHTAEAAGRTSAHCQVLDALAAVELCTPPAKGTSMVAAGGTQETLELTNGETHHDGALSGTPSWKDLAAFCFGPQWHQSSSLSGTFLVDGAESSSGGWNAPYPEEVPHFPRVGKQTANPHPFAEPKLHRPNVTVADASEAAVMEDDDIPDAVFRDAAVGWGAFSDANATAQSGDKRSLEAAPDENEPAAKKLKLLDGTSAPEGTDWAEALPTFYPPFPTHHPDDTRVLLTEAAAHIVASPRHTWNAQPAATDPAADARPPTRLQVRSALLGRRTDGGDATNAPPSFWGDLSSSDRVVPVGRPAVDATTAPSIVPIGRASGSRVSRILEGSMEPPVG
jgi:Bromodomain associated